MCFVGSMGVRTVVLERAEGYCAETFQALGREAFTSSLGAVLDGWVLSLFVNCVPHRLLEHLWDEMLLDGGEAEGQPLPAAPALALRRGDGSLPRGLATVIAFALAGLKCCGEEKLKGSQLLQSLSAKNKAGMPAEELTLCASEAIKSIRVDFMSLPPAHDGDIMSTMARIRTDLVGADGGAARLWEEVRRKKQGIVDCAGDYDQQLMSLAGCTHFTKQEIDTLRYELQDFRRRQRKAGHGVAREDPANEGLDLETFKEVVRRAVPEFPLELCGRLFHKLDAFSVGHLTFAELACGMSALSLGTMDEKLQVCFDLFDSEGRRALTLKDLCDLCTVLFRVALAQGFVGAKTASTDEVLDVLGPRRHSRDNFSLDIPKGDPLGVVSENDDFQPTLPRSARTLSPRALLIAGRDAQNDHAPMPLGGSPGTPPLSPASSSVQHIFSPTRKPARASWSPASSRPLSVELAEMGKDQPWRSMLLRLLAAAQVRSPGGPLVVAFEDFRNAANNEPALLCLFSWCLPRPPDDSDGIVGLRRLTPVSSEQGGIMMGGFCDRLCGWFSFLGGDRGSRTMAFHTGPNQQLDRSGRR